MIHPAYYYAIYINIVLVWTLAQWYRCSSMTTEELLEQRKSAIFAALFALWFIYFYGTRPTWGPFFGDTNAYAEGYIRSLGQPTSVEVGKSEWLFALISQLCKPFLDVHGYLTVIEFGYVVFMAWGCKRLMPNNFGLAFLFCVGAFSFYTYSTNGIRNGLACSILILAISYVGGSPGDKLKAAILCFAAVSIHRSTALPALCMWIGMWMKNTYLLYLFWAFSIIVSALVGETVSNIFLGLGYDDRLDGYIQNRSHDFMFSSTGFRWDFLLYSAMPIWLGYYVVFTRRVVDKQYLILLHTYILANAFWVMVIRASYSNRFAYLSWFLYPLVIAYPLLSLPIREQENDQGRMAGLILAAHFAFTYYMYL